ncbi:MAG: branched-chain amino acid ABC transporter permease [Candidatus Geothermarchaeales archaeon]
MWTERLWAERYKAAVYAAVIVALFSMPLIASPYWLLFVSIYLVYGIVGLAVNLLLGYTGLLSLGHGAFFGIGAYTLTVLCFWYDIYSVEVLLLASVLASLLLSAAIGFLCVRHTKIYFTILTLALQTVLWAIFDLEKFYTFLGSSRGLTVWLALSPEHTTTLLGFEFGPGMSRLDFLQDAFYYYTLTFFIFCVLAMWVIANSPLGKTLKAIKSNPERAEFIGVRVKLHRWIVFIISGTFTGLAGALWAPINGWVGPFVFNWLFAVMFVFFAVIGGTRLYLGPLIGAFVYLTLKEILWAYTWFWSGIMGAVIVVFVLIFPRGILGETSRLIEPRFTQHNPVQHRRRREAS